METISVDSDWINEQFTRITGMIMEMKEDMEKDENMFSMKFGIKGSKIDPS